MEHPHPKYSLERMKSVFAELGLHAEFRPYSVYHEPYTKGEGPFARWVDPVTGVTCNVWAEYELWHDDPDSEPRRDDPEGLRRWTENGDGWYWDHGDHDEDVYGAEGPDLEEAILEAMEAAWARNDWSPDVEHRAISRKLFDRMSRSSDSQVRELAVRLVPYIDEQPV